jgi:hypothetical protein
MITGVSGNRAKTVSAAVPVRPCSAMPPVLASPPTGPDDAAPHAGQVVRRALLRRNIAIDSETAQLAADAVQAALQAGCQALF